MMTSRALHLTSILLLASAQLAQADEPTESKFLQYGAPAGRLPATRHVAIDGLDAAVLPSGRLVTPAGTETSVQAPKPFGLALSPDGLTVATVNSGTGPFSVTLLSGLSTPAPRSVLINVDSAFMGVTFSPRGERFYAAGGEDGTVWVGDTTSARIVGVVNLNGEAHPFSGPFDPASSPPGAFKGTYTGRMAISRDGHYLYVVDQGAFQVHVIDTTLVKVGLDAAGLLREPNNLAAVVARIPTGRYPFDVALSRDGRRLLVANVGTFQYQHLTPARPTGDSNADYPLCYPGVGYPDESAAGRTLRITKVDPSHLDPTLRDPAGIRCGYVPASLDFTVPGLGSPNVAESNSLWIFDVSNPLAAVRQAVVKTGPAVAETLAAALAAGGDEDDDRYAGPHPNAIAVGGRFAYVTNGNDDSVAVVPLAGGETRRIPLSPLQGADRGLRGVQPVALALSPDGTTLYVAEAGLNAVAVIRLGAEGGQVVGHIPTGWWPAAVVVSADGRTLYVANANGRGAGPNLPTPPDNLGSPKSATIGSVSVIPVPDAAQLARSTQRVMRNNGFARDLPRAELARLEAKVKALRSTVKHVIFVNKENATHDLILGDVTKTASGQPVNGEPSLALDTFYGVKASPNHHALALRYAFSDNFFLEPSVSSDGHRWLANTYTSEFEQTHWAASYGGRRRDAGDDPAVYLPYPGRLGFTDANASPEPNDLNQQGGIAMHLARHGRSFVNFGNGFELAQVDEDLATEPTGIRNHVNVPMEKVIRDRSDHLFPEFNTAIPDAPLPPAEDPTGIRFSRFGRFKQVFEAHYVDRTTGACKLPDYVDLYYPNDHGGGSCDIHPDRCGEGPPFAWDFTRFVQDNDAALGLTVELLAGSPCWKETVIFVVEDDAQNGFDHVDGHRSIFLAIGPAVKPGYLLKTHASLSSVFKTADLLLGIPPLNLYDAAASDLLELFADAPGKAAGQPFQAARVEFDSSNAAAWQKATEGVDFSARDQAEVPLRNAIMQSAGQSRKKAEGRWEER
jgi:DNA-binding beta-propeller fold protein YncE